MLDFSKFKKVAEDKKTATMKHDGGHTITVALKALSPVQREAMKRLPLHEDGKEKLKKEEKKDKLPHYDEGTPDAPVSSDDADTDQKPPVTVNVNAAPPSVAAGQATTQVPVQQPTLNTANPPVNLPNGSTNPTGAMQMGQEAAANQQKIDTAKAQAMVPVEQARIQAEQQQAQRDQNNVNALSTHADNLAANIKSINPNAAWDNMSDPKKVSTSIGLFLGGLSVPFHGTNFAQDTLNKSLDRDVQAQIQNNDNQKTIFGAYNTLYGNQVIASKMARASMADIYTDQASKIAQQLGTPQAFVNLQKLKSDLAVSKAKDIRDAAVNFNALPNFSGGNGNPQVTNQPAGQPGTATPVNYTQPGQPGASNAPQESNEFKILTPEANSASYVSGLLNPQYHPEIGESDRAEIAKQMTQASQAEKSLGGLNKLFADLGNESKNGGATGWIHRQLSPHALGAAGAAIGTGLGGHAGTIVGGAIGEGLGYGAKALTGTDEKARQFDSDKSALVGYISSALKGTNIASDQIQDIVDKNAPEFNDSKATIDKKLTAIKHFIIQHTETDALKRHGLSYK